MKYYVFHCSNGFCGCNEDFYKKINNDDIQELDNIAEDILYNEYGFAEPDERFIDVKYEYEEYKENLYVSYEEITKEEYEENI